VDEVSVLVVVLVVAAIATCAMAVFALYEAIVTLRRSRAFLADADHRLFPLLDKADITIDAINAELLRVDTIVTQLEDVAEGVTTASHVVREAAHAPASVANALGSRLRRLARDFRK
jgi:hypothetical protein